MKVKKVKLTGFKSFVDSTTMEITSGMTGIVGPNGCGKSNIIDAVRWLMGQSARNIRATNVEDVIFNGTSARKPVGQASVELVFGNEDGSFGGRYASFGEISVKRTADRARDSKYFINNVRCRRRDVADLFLGTGLGTHSYALVEQGMISRIIEADPKEMRRYVEEAAGISKYHERRREAEIRIRHTRENLDRLLDIREEVTKQLDKLKRQAKSAQKFKELRLEKDKISATIAALELRAHKEKCDDCERQLSDLRVEVERERAQLRGNEAETEEKRVGQTESNRKLNEIREEFYRLNASVGGVEQDIANRRKNAEQIKAEVAAVAEALRKCEEKIREQESKHARTKTKLSETEEEAAAANSELAEIDKRLKDEEDAFAKASREWERQHSDASEANEALEVSAIKADYCDRELEEIARQEKELKESRAGLDADGLKRQVADLYEYRNTCRADIDKRAEQISDLQNAVAACRKELNEAEQASADSRQKLHEVREQLASLKALQDADGGEAFSKWLMRHDLAEAPRLATKLELDQKWATAVETVLGNLLTAVEVDSLERYAKDIGQSDLDMLVMFEKTEDVKGEERSLASKVKTDCGINSLLGQIVLADDLEQALAMRKDFSSRQSAVTPDGFWVGHNWIRAHRQSDKKKSILARQHIIDELNGQYKELGEQAKSCEEEGGRVKAKLADNENRLEQTQKERLDLLDRTSAAEADWRRAEVKLDHAQDMLAELDDKEVQLSEWRKSIEAQRAEHVKLRDELMGSASVQSANRSTIKNTYLESEKKVAALRESLRLAQDTLHKIEIERHSLTTLAASLGESLNHLRHQKEELSARRQSLVNTEKDFHDPIESKRGELKRLIEQRQECEEKVREKTAELDMLQRETDTLERQRRDIETLHGELLEKRGKIQVDLREGRMRSEDAEERIKALDMSADEIEKELTDEDSLDSLQEKLTKTERRIDRLGPINLVADQEFSDLDERKEYIDSQHADLTSALETLEKAMTKLDRESRERFKNTFNDINARLEERFAKLFGGGSAHLELLENDWLKSGVAVMVRPPGKRLSSIKLLSGGEKALAAMAVVFTIFDLNPAPFCMLDEVDAPLDETNVTRFCEVVREMSQRVQFIVITHNRLTMESMSCLIGVTMGEPGVSRLVSVNVDEAAAMVGE